MGRYHIERKIHAIDDDATAMPSVAIEAQSMKRAPGEDEFP